MTAKPAQLWTRFRQSYREFPSCRISLDLSRINFAPDFFAGMSAAWERAFAAMKDLEAGGVANPSEGRQVGHYWLRNPEIGPPALRGSIYDAVSDLKRFSADVHTARIQGEQGPFKRLLVVGIGGSALGPQFLASALGHPLTDRLEVRFLDNTDPEGIDRTLAAITHELGRTLVVVISKSGTTPETRNGMLEVEEAFARAGLRFARHAVAITLFDKAKSQLYAKASAEGWRAMFPMWDWVGGRTSVTSAVGLFPAALQGLDVDGLLAGARACDEKTRLGDWNANPSALLALAWYSAAAGRGAKDMVVLPYKDRLELFARYLQQLVMESLGKAHDKDQNLVNQGLAVYGNKGSTDQHAYVQQLRDGLPNFFAVFVRVLRARNGGSLEVAPGATSGDFLNGFLLGTRRALFENGRESITISIPEVSAFTVGSLIALFERAVGFYASLVGVNAYDQPGVEAGKKAASDVLALQSAVLGHLRAHHGCPFTAESLASAVDSDDPETVFLLCQHLVANVTDVRQSGSGIDATFSA